MRHWLFLLIVLALPAALAIAGEDPAAVRADWERRLEALDGSDVRAAYALGLQLQAKGHDDLARKAFEIVIAIDTDHVAARRELGYEQIRSQWLRGDDLHRAKGFVRHEKRWMTAEEFAEATRPQREAAEQQAGEKRVTNLLAMIASEDPDTVAKARRQMGGVDARFKLAPLAKALRAEPASLRVYAAEELGRLADPLAGPALLKRAMYDENQDVRTAVVAALRAIGSPSTVHPLGRALGSRYSEIRVRAAEALAQLGDELGMPYLIKRWEGRSGDFPQVYFMQAKQISYIQDFDVEVAQTSFIADPIVGVLQEGVVQAVKIHATEQTFYTFEKVAYKSALSSLAGTDLGDVRAWRTFWTENEKRLVRERNERYAEQAAARKAAAR